MKDRSFHYKFLDIVRLYCALLVILIHTGLGDGTAVIACLTRQAVPFFFLVSGFFFTKKVVTCDRIWRFTFSYARQIIVVYLIWILLWLPATVLEYSQLYSQSHLLLIAVLFRRLFLAGIAPYWYLLVLFEGILFLAVIIRYDKMLPAALLCAVGLALSIIYGIQADSNRDGLVYKAFYTVFSWNNNVIMCGFPLLYLGAAAAMKEDRLCRLDRRVLILLYVLSVVSAFALFFIRGTLYHIPVGPVQALLLFLICISDLPFQDKIPDRLCTFSRNLSSVIFLTHTVFLVVLGNVLHIWDLTVRYLITVACSLILMLAARKLNWKALNTLLMVKKWD